MCGIAGILAPSWPRERNEGAAERMCDAIWHRGPDDAGYSWADGVGLGMRRLSIVDVSGGHQPMATEDGSASIVFNGEIYNAPALRQMLVTRGHRFRTRSDTEVILHLYQDRGLEFAGELRGMWAIAIHDRRSGKLVLSRDRLGIKPLYVLEDGEATFFASELRAFRAIPGELSSSALAWDPAAAHAMLSWSYVPGTATIYERVRSVEPGTHDVLGPTGVRQHRYWRLAPNADARGIRSMAEAVELTSVELKRAVKEHLESDVPVAAFVSGGIDSGLIAAYATDESPGISTFSIGFDVPAFDESSYAAQVARRLGARHVTRRMGESDVYGALVEVLTRCDGPFGDSSLIATWAVSRLAAQTHKVVLSGDGGDEVFAGYAKHSIVRWRHRLRMLSGAPFLALDDVLGKLPQSRERRTTNLIRQLRRAIGALGVPPEVAYASLTRITSLQESAALLLRPPVDSPFLDDIERRFLSGPGDNELSRTLATDLAIVLPNDMLSKVDQASMLNSLETRVPLLDHKLVELGWSLPDRFKLGSNEGKLVLRRLFAQRFTAKLAQRKKQGFRVPVESWLAGPLAPALEWVFAPDRLERHGLLDPRTLGASQRHSLLIRRPLLLWNAFCLAVWCEISTGTVSDQELRSILSTGRGRGSG